MRAARGVIERSSYERRTPATTVLHTVVREHLESFLADARQRSGHGTGVPRHVERELRNYLACGILAHGFVRVRCVDCGFDRLLAFSCKGRAVCPSCRGRRMADAAVHLVDRVLPCAPYRQWTLSVPWRLRALLARDRRLLSAALTCFVRAVFRWQRAQARALGIVGAAPGAVTAIQRFGSVLNLNVHFHTLIPDGVFVTDGAGGARFVPLPAPSDDEVAALCARVARRILRLVDGDDDRDDDDATGGLLAEASRSPMGTLPFAMMPPPPPAKRLTANVDEFTLHADTAVAAYDRDGLARDGARPPFAHRRLRLTAWARSPTACAGRGSPSQTEAGARAGRLPAPPRGADPTAPPEPDPVSRGVRRQREAPRWRHRPRARRPMPRRPRRPAPTWRTVPRPRTATAALAHAVGRAPAPCVSRGPPRLPPLYRRHAGARHHHRSRRRGRHPHPPRRPGRGPRCRRRSRSAAGLLVAW